MSLGGVLGGIFAALISPLLFVDVLEFPMLLAASIAAGLLHQNSASPSARKQTKIALTIVAISVGAAIIAKLTGLGAGTAVRLWAVAVASSVLLATVQWPQIAASFGIVTALAAIALPPEHPPLHATRSFFGTHRVIATNGGRIHTIQHGTTLHGAELRTDNTGNPIARPPPLTYYHASGPTV